MNGKQIEFPPEQTQDPRVVPFMLGLSIVCVVVVVVILLTDFDGAFLGPW